jgi:hypothetical protein
MIGIANRIMKFSQDSPWVIPIRETENDHASSNASGQSCQLTSKLPTDFLEMKED